MSWVSFGSRMAYVSWWPRDYRLHYAELCCGIYEFLRMPPCHEHLAEAIQYYDVLMMYRAAPMQMDRILWTREWIRDAKASVFVG